MSRPDYGTHTEADAGEYERMTGPSVSRRELAEDAGYDPADNAPVVERADCACGTCLECLMWASVWRDKQAQRAREWSA